MSLQDESSLLINKDPLFPNEIPFIEETTTQDSVSSYHPEKKRSLLLTCFNLFNDILGPSTVTMPYFIAQSGLYLGIVLMFIYGALSDFTLLRVRELASTHKLTSFSEMSYNAYGQKGFVIANILIFIFNWGGYIGALVTLGTIFPDVLEYLIGPHSLFSRTNILIFSVIFVSPIAFYKGIAQYAFVSLFCCLAIFFVCFLVVYRFLRDGYISTIDARAPYHAFYWINTDFFDALKSLGGISYLYTCHDMFGHVLHSLENPTPKREAIVVHSCCIGMFVWGCVIGVCGYLMFFDDVKSNILDNFATTNLLNNVCRIVLIFNTTINIPYSLFMPRVACLAIIQLWKPELVVKKEGNRVKRNILHSFITIFQLLSGLIIAIIVTDLGIVYSLVGGISAISISLILPPLCFLRLERHGSKNIRFGCYVVLVLGILGMIGCLCSFITSWVA